MNKKNKTRLIYSLVAILLLLGLVAGVGYARKKKAGKPGLNQGTDEAAQRINKAAALSRLGATQYVAT